MMVSTGISGVMKKSVIRMSEKEQQLSGTGIWTPGSPFLLDTGKHRFL